MNERVKHISKPLKQLTIRLLLALLKGLNLGLKSFFNLFKKIFFVPGKWLVLFFYRYIILNIYKAIYALKKLFKIIVPTERVALIYIFINKYVSHLVIIILVLTISFANIFTSETKAETFGEKSILFTLTTGTNIEEEYIEEIVVADEPKITSYQASEAGAVSATQQIYTNEQPKEIETGLVMTEDSTALVKPEISSMEGSKSTRDKILEYTVAGGDTISSIAENFGISQETILWENNLTKFSLIRPGQILVILPTSGLSHKIVSGDSLDKIAKKYQTDKAKIIDFNKLASEQDVIVGQTLIIPDGQPYYAPAPAKKPLASITKIFTPAKDVKPDLSPSDKMLWPTTAHRISQYYNWRHTGLDIDGDFGDPIWAAEDGVITKSVCLNYGYGCHVIIDHGEGKTTLYAHFQKLYVKEGQKVSRGDTLGEQGSTGKSTGSHLHFEVRYSGKKYNPLNYIK